MPKTPTIPDEFRDLLDVEVAMLATNGHDGAPQVTAIWFLHDKSDDQIRLSLNDTRQKVKNLRKNPNATLFILDPANPYRSLEIRGHVELTPDPEFAFVEEVGAKYGQDPHQYDQPGDTRSIVILHPTQVKTTHMGG
jgi:PPOX class probable F420-dependent enzyme